tara:strand:+ start:33 stop:1406 length:1374 start_codon:yes stop_codon:yes gene_type:complete
MASTYIKRDLSVSETIYKWTWSAWVKRSGSFNTVNTLFKSRQDGNNWVQVYFGDGGHADELLVASYKNGGYHYTYSTSKKFKDVNAWYHIVVNVDSSQSTAGDRVRIYVNGERETSFANSTNNLSNGDSLIFNTSDSGTGHTIGSWNAGSYFDGSMSHVHYSSGYSYAPTVFGSTDSTTGEWKINTAPSFTLGGNGYTVLKDGNTITDQSSNSNDFTVGGGTLTKTEDNPSNVFCTMNPLMNYSNGTPTFSHGNNKVDGSGTAWMRTVGTLGNRTGKFYYEAYIETYNSNHYKPQRLGWDSIDFPRAGSENYYSGFNISTDGYIRGGIKGYGNYDPNAEALGTTLAQGDYLGFAIDLDNDLISIYKNGTVISNVNNYDISGKTNCSIKKSYGYQVSPSMNFYSQNAGDNKCDFNFGNGAFGSTQLTGTTYQDSNGQGVFKYQPPTNYLAWCTKNFNV